MLDNVFMLGAIAGGIIGSPYEIRPIKYTDFPLCSPQGRFTDDTVLTIAGADCLLHGGSFIDRFHDYWQAYLEAWREGVFFAPLRETPD